MFLEKPSAFGLDLSDLSQKIILLKKTGQQTKLASFARHDIPEGVVELGVIKKEKELIESIKRAIEQVKGEKIKTKDCIVSLPETESYIRLVQLPKIAKEEIGEAIKWEIEANIPVSLEDIYFDWQLVEGSVNKPDQYNILIGALPKTLVDPYLEVIKKAGLRPLAFEIESIATARALIKEGIKTPPLVIIDLGAQRTSFMICVNGTVWLTTSLPISNNMLIDDIEKKIKVSHEKAKELKFKIGLDTSGENLEVYKAMEPRLLALVNEIRKYIDYCQAANPGSQALKVEKIILSGGGANLKGLPLFLSSQLKSRVEVGNPWVNIIEPSTSELPELAFLESLTYTTAIGLAIRGLKYT